MNELAEDDPIFAGLGGAEGIRRTNRALESFAHGVGATTDFLAGLAARHRSPPVHVEDLTGDDAPAVEWAVSSTGPSAFGRRFGASYGSRAEAEASERNRRADAAEHRRRLAEADKRRTREDRWLHDLSGDDDDDENNAPRRGGLRGHGEPRRRRRPSPGSLFDVLDAGLDDVSPFADLDRRLPSRSTTQPRAPKEKAKKKKNDNGTSSEALAVTKTGASSSSSRRAPPPKNTPKVITIDASDDDDDDPISESDDDSDDDASCEVVDPKHRGGSRPGKQAAARGVVRIGSSSPPPAPTRGQQQQQLPRSWKKPAYCELRASAVYMGIVRYEDVTVVFDDHGLKMEYRGRMSGIECTVGCDYDALTHFFVHLAGDDGSDSVANAAGRRRRAATETAVTAPTRATMRSFFAFRTRNRKGLSSIPEKHYSPSCDLTDARAFIVVAIDDDAVFQRRVLDVFVLPDRPRAGLAPLGAVWTATADRTDLRRSAFLVGVRHADDLARARQQQQQHRGRDDDQSGSLSTTTTTVDGRGDALEMVDIKRRYRRRDHPDNKRPRPLDDENEPQQPRRQPKATKRDTLPATTASTVLFTDDEDDDEVVVVDAASRGNTKDRKRNATTTAKGATPTSTVAFVYPDDPSAADAVSVAVADRDRLEDGEFLNDNLINCVLRHTVLTAPAARQARTHVFSTYFLPRMVQTSDDAAAAAEAVDRWTKTDLFAKDLLVVPVNEHLHWSLAVVCNPGAAPPETTTTTTAAGEEDAEAVASASDGDDSGAAARGRKRPQQQTGGRDAPVCLDDDDDDDEEAEDDAPARCGSCASSSDAAAGTTTRSPAAASPPRQRKKEAAPPPPSPGPPFEDKKLPCILVLDSLRCHDAEKIARYVRAFLRREYAKQRGADPGARFDARTMPVLALTNIPEQPNSYDCGVYLLEYFRTVFERGVEIDVAPPKAHTGARTRPASSSASLVARLGGGQRFSKRLFDAGVIRRRRDEFKAFFDAQRRAYAEAAARRASPEARDTAGGASSMATTTSSPGFEEIAPSQLLDDDGPTPKPSPTTSAADSGSPPSAAAAAPPPPSVSCAEPPPRRSLPGFEATDGEATESEDELDRQFGVSRAQRTPGVVRVTAPSTLGGGVLGVTDSPLL